MNQEKFEHFQPLGSNDPAYTGVGMGALTADTPAFTPLMLDATSNALVVWDGTHAGQAVGVLALDTAAGTSMLTYYKSGTLRIDVVKWPEGVSDTLKYNAFVGSALSVV
ncbi:MULTISPECIES: head decoration protein [Hafnia]|uniref:head decoration protein n=1 Tax=Hafnia TaxID=568 RepID=UPI0029D76DB8|nr:head decoration protein [Hafnia alvei]EHP5272048.1 head decoration protein [Escherichia coli]MDX6845484.1 head decoration protein [Hafnia alvei]